jgi:hypothetical protein
VTNDDDDIGPEGGEESGGSRRLRIGATVISFLGLSFGGSLAVCGSVFRWRSDTALGLFNQSGWQYDNLVAGDGKITLALGALMAMGLIIGAVFLNRWAYAVAITSASLLLAASIYELVSLVSAPGLTGPGHGVYMVLGGGVAGLLCSLGGYLMTSEGDVAPRPVAA